MARLLSLSSKASSATALVVDRLRRPGRQLLLLPGRVAPPQLRLPLAETAPPSGHNAVAKGESRHVRDQNIRWLTCILDILARLAANLAVLARQATSFTRSACKWNVQHGVR